jgi:hypothetical protein
VRELHLRKMFADEIQAIAPSGKIDRSFTS